jgi:hypothetical protein
MSENVCLSSWAELPLEILDKIFNFVPRLMVGSLGFVCKQWQCALHNQAVKYLNSCIKQQLIEERQLQKWGWNTAAATAPDHNVLDCNCVHLAFNFFTQKKRLKTDSNILRIRQVCNSIQCWCIMGEKIFLGCVEDGQEKFKVFNRLTPEAEPRVVSIPAHYQDGISWAGMSTYEDLLVVWLSGDQEQVVSLWNGNDEVWLEDLDISSRTPGNHNVEDVALSKNLIAVSFNGDQAARTLFWLVNTSQPTNLSTQFMGTVSHVYTFFEIKVFMNERFVGFYYRFDNDFSEELLVIDQKKLFNDNRSYVAERARLVDPNFAGNDWCSIEEVAFGQVIAFKMEPGKSVRLAGEMFDLFKFRIFNMVTGGVLCDIDLRPGIFPACWCGGNFLFLGTVGLPCQSNKEGILQVVTIDPRCRHISELKVLVDQKGVKKKPEDDLEDIEEDREKDNEKNEKDVFVHYGPTVRYSGTNFQDFKRGSLQQDKTELNFLQVRTYYRYWYPVVFTAGIAQYVVPVPGTSFSFSIYLP